MSGLNPVTRLLLRLAHRLAGEGNSEWSAAMAAETDAAGNASFSWALGCAFAGLRMRFAGDWKRIVFVAFSPAIAIALTPPAFVVAMALRPLFDSPGPLFVSVMLLPMALVLFAVGYSTRSGLPWRATLWFFFGFNAISFMIFWLGTGRSPTLLLAPQAEWMGLPRDQGLLLMLTMLFTVAALGRITARRWKQAASS